ncbi:MAG: GIY-YIG nuclease family protein, partial [Myxococcota bacterium]
MTLRDLEVLVLDAQATGASPAHGHLLELGWAWTTASRESLRVQAHLLALPDEATLPRIITRVTGIEQADLDDAADVDAIWDGFVDECSARAPARAVIHCARFEHSFLQPRIAPEQTLPFASVCTLELARRLLPDLPRRGLRALAGYFGYGVDQLRRCEDHVHATAFVWRHLVDMLAEQGVETWEEAAAFAGTAAPKRSKKRVFPIPKETRLAVPDRPGVYRMLRTNGDVLYVGKATSLKRRVNSYFQKQSGRNERMLELLSQVRDLDVTPTATPLEAALLETDTIKMLQPPYNMALLETSREPCFVTRDLLDAAPEASEAYPVGPLPSSWRQQRYVGLHGLLAGDRTTDTITRAFGWEPEALP